MKVSAGVLLYRRGREGVEVLVAHPGGPYFARRDAGAWTIPKGLVEDGETLREAARREFEEETGFPCPAELLELPPVRLESGKRVHAFAAEGDVDPEALESNTFEMEIPRGSGRIRRYPEIDRVQFVSVRRARDLLNPAQVPLLDALLRHLANVSGSD